MNLTSSSVKRSPIVVRSSLSRSSFTLPTHASLHVLITPVLHLHNLLFPSKHIKSCKLRSLIRQVVRISVPELSSSKQANAFRMTSSGSVPFSFSPNMVRNIVKLICPGASLIMASSSSSVGFLPIQSYQTVQTLFADLHFCQFCNQKLYRVQYVCDVYSFRHNMY